MAMLRCIIVAAIIFLYQGNSNAQTVYYPPQASTLLKSAVADISQLFKKAMPGASFLQQAYTSTTPSAGIIFVYDTAVGAQGCRIESDGQSFLKFTAAEDNGLLFGTYEYLWILGYRFWQPGTIWETIPTLSSPYKSISSTVAHQYKYNTWFISGGHNTWAMDKNASYGWETYFGENGHQWSLYQRRNRMTGAYRFSGHRSDIMNSSYMATLQSNACYVACYNGTRQAGIQSVPDIGNPMAIQLWAGRIEQKFTQFKSTVYGNTNLYADLYRNYTYANHHIGIEVSDGAQWGNSKDEGGCGNMDYPKESDQQFILASQTAQRINASYPGKRFQCYAYNTHADIPSASVAISSNIDVQVIPTAFQNVSSPVGLLNRWYNKHNYISEYQYLNIPQWGGETPMSHTSTLKQTLQRIQEKHRQGICWEASPAKFASLPFLLAATEQLEHNIPFDTTVRKFCVDMFGEASGTIYQLLQAWGDEKIITTGDFIPDNKYKIPYWFQLLNKAVQQTTGSSLIIKQRLSELKAYLHYMVLYYDWYFDQRSLDAKSAKAGELCIYLAKISKLQIVNSYFLITDIASRYGRTGEFYIRYNPADGTAYENGTLPLITPEIIEADFTADLAAQSALVSQYQFTDPSVAKSKLSQHNLGPIPVLNVKIGYTNGYDYPNRSEFYIDAPGAGTFIIAYKPGFDLAGKGMINFTVENTGKGLSVIQDLTISNGSNNGNFTVTIPEAGTYKLSVVSKQKASVELAITTNGNYFYRNTAFLGNKTENYRSNLLSLPGYFYVPAGVNKVFFSVNNSNPGGAGFATAEQVGQTFLFTDIDGNAIKPALATPAEGGLFYLPVTGNTSGVFLHTTKMEQYNACFANISNTLWYAAKSPCSDANFYAGIVVKNGDCITRLTAANDQAGLQWTITDVGKQFNYQGTSVDLPNYISPNAIVTLKTVNNCVTTKRLGDDTLYLRRKEACGSGAPLPGKASLVLYPNPSAGVFYCMVDNGFVKAEEIIVSDLAGKIATRLNNTGRIDISRLPAGMYLYRCRIEGQWSTGKLVKQ